MDTIPDKFLTEITIASLQKSHNKFIQLLLFNSLSPFLEQNQNSLFIHQHKIISMIQKYHKCNDKQDNRMKKSIRGKKILLISDKNKINILSSSRIEVWNLEPYVNFAALIKLLQPIPTETHITPTTKGAQRF